MTTEIIVLLDRSGSMASTKSDTELGFDEFVRKQQETKGRANLTLVQFDSVGIDTVYEGTPVKHVPKLKLEPRGMTPLLDSIGKTINSTKHRLLRGRRKVDQVIFVIVTDGLENYSREFTKSQILSLINEANKELDWEFVYLGANQDAIQEGMSMGIRHSFNYKQSPIHTHRLWGAVGQSVSSYRESDVLYMAASAVSAINSASAPGYVQ